MASQGKISCFSEDGGLLHCGGGELRVWARLSGFAAGCDEGYRPAPAGKRASYPQRDLSADRSRTAQPQAVISDLLKIAERTRPK